MKHLTLLFAVLLLAGCSGWMPETKTVKVETTVFPELPPVPPVARLTLIPCIPDRPRKYWEELQVKSDTQCRKEVKDNPNITKNSKFQDRCMEHPIDTESNIVIGFDKTGEQCYTLNTEKIRQHIFTLQRRIESVNEQRLEWKQRNEDQRSSRQDTQ